MQQNNYKSIMFKKKSKVKFLLLVLIVFVVSVIVFSYLFSPEIIELAIFGR